MVFTEWLSKAGPVVLFLFIVAVAYLVWYLKGRKSSKDTDNVKTSQNLDNSIREGSISKEDAEIIRESLP